MRAIVQRSSGFYSCMVFWSLGGAETISKQPHDSSKQRTPKPTKQPKSSAQEKLDRNHINQQGNSSLPQNIKTQHKHLSQNVMRCLILWSLSAVILLVNSLSGCFDGVFLTRISSPPRVWFPVASCYSSILGICKLSWSGRPRPSLGLGLPREVLEHHHYPASSQTVHSPYIRVFWRVAYSSLISCGLGLREAGSV